MKKLFSTILVMLLWCNVGFAVNKIPDLALGHIEFKAPLSINGEFIDTKYEFKKKSKGNVDCLAFTKSPITSSYRSVPESKGTCKWEQDGTKFRIFHDKSNVYGKSIIEGVIDPSLGTIKGVIKYKGTNVSHDFSGVVWSSRYLEKELSKKNIEVPIQFVPLKFCQIGRNTYYPIVSSQTCVGVFDWTIKSDSQEAVKYSYDKIDRAICYNEKTKKVSLVRKSCKDPWVELIYVPNPFSDEFWQELSEKHGNHYWTAEKFKNEYDWFKPKNTSIKLSVNPWPWFYLDEFDKNNEDIEKNKKLEEERKKIAEEKRKIEEEKNKIAEEKRKIEEEKRQKEEEERNYLALVKNFGPECESSWRNFWTGHNVGTPEFDKCLVDKKQENDKKILVQKNKEEEEKKAKQLEKEKAEKEIAKLTPDEKRAYTCKNTFGFRKGTDKFKDCVFQIYAAELELAKLEVEKQLAESQLEIAKANREAAEARAEATRQAALRAKAEANAAKAQKLTEQAQLEAAQALVEATNQQTAQMKANAKQAEQNALISILSQRLGTGSTLLQNNTTGPSTVNCRWVGAFFSCF